MKFISLSQDKLHVKNFKVLTTIINSVFQILEIVLKSGSSMQ